MTKMTEDVASLGKILADREVPLAKRFRTLFTLRNIITEESIDQIAKVLLEDDSDLLKHECAYCMGQMKKSYAIPFLVKAIKDENQHPMVRHEAGEALAAIQSETEEVLQVLQEYSKHPVRELSETCILALDKFKWNRRKDDEKKRYLGKACSPYNAVDPVPAWDLELEELSIKQLTEIFEDKTAPLFNRYAALFTLRNLGADWAITTICLGLSEKDEKSALLKHEIAFVLGQIQSPLAIKYLSDTLADQNENEIVRHECAEALGAIGRSDLVKGYINDPSRIVRESCVVAMDMAEYYGDKNQFSF